MVKQALHRSDGVLKQYGFIVFVPTGGEFVLPVADDFQLEIGKWQWTGTAYMPFLPPPPTDAELTAKALSDAEAKPYKAILLVVRQYCNALKAGTFAAKTIAEVRDDFITAWKTLP